MRTQNLVDTVLIPGHFSFHQFPDAVASFAVMNDVNLTHLSYEEEDAAGKQLAEFLLDVIPAGVLDAAFHKLEAKVLMLEELGELFDEIAFDKLCTSVDPGLNAFFVDKNNQWNGGVGSTTQALSFIQKAIEYAQYGHVEKADAK
jgi:hypothetical protein